MLEGVFHQSDEEQGGNQHSFGRCRECHLYIDLVRQAEAHQVDVVAHEGQFFVERDEGLAVFVEHMAEQVAQVVDGILGAIGVDGDEGVDVVEGVEQEVWIQLAFQVLEFRFGACLFQFLAFVFGDVPVGGHFNGDAEGGGQCHHGGVAQDEHHFRRTGMAVRGVADNLKEIIVVPPVQQQGEEDEQQEVRRQKMGQPLAEQQAVDEQKIVGVKDDDESYRHESVADVARPSHGFRLFPDEEERERENDGPADQLDDVLEGLVLFHACKDNIFVS